MPKNKKFIDKKNAITFHLVHRSQKDPLITDETAPQHVLVEASNLRENATKDSKAEDPSTRKKEQQKYGVFFDDDYNYLQHLRQSDGPSIQWEYVETPNLKGKRPQQIDDEDRTNYTPKPNIQLPSSVFASEYEEDEGLLRKAAPRPGPRPDWDPDVVAALDDDFDYTDPDNALDDDFVKQAMVDEGSDEDADGDYNDDDSDFNVSDNEEDRDVLGPLQRHSFNDEEIKSRFTEYSMSSSVIRRNEQLELLDERFEKFFENYDEPEIGPLDCDEIEGHVDITDDLLMKCLSEYKRDDRIEPYDRKWDEQRIKKMIEEGSSDEEMVEMDVDDDGQKKWDCESILSTYSNLYNHPKLIDEAPRRNLKIKIDKKTGIPMNVFRGENSELTVKSLAKFNNENSATSPTKPTTGPKSLCDQSVLSVLSVLSIRPKDETAEEKLERKRLLKDYKRERRIERKANTKAFKDEQIRQDKLKIVQRNAMQGKSIV